jgi:hypothetical protein
LNNFFETFFDTLFFLEGTLEIRVICKVREREHQNPEFGHTQGQIFFKPAKKYISIERGLKLRATLDEGAGSKIPVTNLKQIGPINWTFLHINK